MDFSNIEIGDILLSLTSYITIWVFCLFMVLPFFVERQDLSKRTVEDMGAPKHHYMKRKVVITSLIALVFWLGLNYWLLRDGFEFREWILSF